MNHNPFTNLLKTTTKSQPWVHHLMIPRLEGNTIPPKCMTPLLNTKIHIFNVFKVQQVWLAPPSYLVSIASWSHNCWVISILQMVKWLGGKENTPKKELRKDRRRRWKGMTSGAMMRFDGEAWPHCWGGRRVQCIVIVEVGEEQGGWRKGSLSKLELFNFEFFC